VTEVIPGPQHFACCLADGSAIDLPPFFSRFLRRADGLTQLSPEGGTVLIERTRRQSQSQYLLYARIGHVTQPRESENGAGFFVRAEVPKSDLSAVLLSGEAIRRYFYLLDADKRPISLYGLLRASELATPADLRVAWRIRQLELGLYPADAAERARAERAFNILAHSELRGCYDALRRDEDAPPLFPYGGCGSILVEGHLSDKGEAFFANRILAYKPELVSRRVSLLLRQCEFFADRAICRDPRRKLEISLDPGLFPGIDWDLTWNQWKHWLRNRIKVDATFVQTGKYRLRNGEWTLRTWFTALPSQLRVTLPEGIAADVERARAIHALLGDHAEVVGKIRAEIEKQTVEHVQIQDWFDRLGVSSHLKPQHVTWRPDYEPYYFERLRRRCATWFLFRGEYLFAWANVLISEIPQPGHATYVFAKPEDIHLFMDRYCRATREDVRRNRDNVAADLGFVGRVARGGKKERWLNDVLKLAGEKADYMEVFD